MRPKKSYDVSLTHIEDFSNYGDDGYLELSKCDTCMTKTHEKRHERRLCVVCTELIHFYLSHPSRIGRRYIDVYS